MKLIVAPVLLIALGGCEYQRNVGDLPDSGVVVVMIRDQDSGAHKDATGGVSHPPHEPDAGMLSGRVEIRNLAVQKTRSYGPCTDGNSTLQSCADFQATFVLFNGTDHRIERLSGIDFIVAEMPAEVSGQHCNDSRITMASGESSPVLELDFTMGDGRLGEPPTLCYPCGAVCSGLPGATVNPILKEVGASGDARLILNGLLDDGTPWTDNVATTW